MGKWTDLSTWRGPTVNSGSQMTGHRGLVVHIAEGYYEGTISWQRNPEANVSSHFIVGRLGQCAQMVDTTYKSWAQKLGNAEWLSVECEGFTLTHPLHKPGWEQLTSAQLETIARLLARAYKVYGVPLVLATGPATGGLAWHSMGAEYGVTWGHPDCPGQPIKEQLPAIVARARTLAGIVTPAPRPALTWTEIAVHDLPTLRQGSQGIAVRRMQALANVAGARLAIDGVFGPATTAAVKTLQGHWKLTRDGVVGQKTWPRLLGV